MEGNKLWEYINENIKNTVGQEEDYHITAFNKLQTQRGIGNNDKLICR